MGNIPFYQSSMPSVEKSVPCVATQIAITRLPAGAVRLLQTRESRVTFTSTDPSILSPTSDSSQEPSAKRRKTRHARHRHRSIDCIKKALPIDEAKMLPALEKTTSIAEAKLQRQKERIEQAEANLLSSTSAQAGRSRNRSRGRGKSSKSSEQITHANTDDQCASLRSNDSDDGVTIAHDSTLVPISHGRDVISNASNQIMALRSIESDGGVPIASASNLYSQPAQPQSASSVSVHTPTTSDSEPTAAGNIDDAGFQVYTSRRGRGAGARQIPITTDGHQSAPAPYNIKEIYEVFGNHLPGPEFISQNMSSVNGKVQCIIMPNGNIPAYQWNQASFTWDNIGQYSDIRKKIEGQLAGERLRGETASQNVRQHTLPYFAALVKQREAQNMKLPFGQKDIRRYLPDLPLNLENSTSTRAGLLSGLIDPDKSMENPGNFYSSNDGQIDGIGSYLPRSRLTLNENDVQRHDRYKHSVATPLPPRSGRIHPQYEQSFESVSWKPHSAMHRQDHQHTLQRNHQDPSAYHHSSPAMPAPSAPPQPISPMMTSRTVLGTNRDHPFLRLPYNLTPAAVPSRNHAGASAWLRGDGFDLSPIQPWETVRDYHYRPVTQSAYDLPHERESRRTVLYDPLRPVEHSPSGRMTTTRTGHFHPDPYSFKTTHKIWPNIDDPPPPYDPDVYEGRSEDDDIMELRMNLQANSFVPYLTEDGFAETPHGLTSHLTQSMPPPNDPTFVPESERDNLSMLSLCRTLEYYIYQDPEQRRRRHGWVKPAEHLIDRRPNGNDSLYDQHVLDQIGKPSLQDKESQPQASEAIHTGYRSAPNRMAPIGRPSYHSNYPIRSVWDVSDRF